MSRIVTGGVVIDNVLEDSLTHTFMRLIFKSSYFLHDYFQTIYHNGSTLFLTSFDENGVMNWNGWAKIHIMLVVDIEAMTTQRNLANGEIQLDLIFLPFGEVAMGEIDWENEGF